MKENYEKRNNHLLARLEVPISNKLPSFDNGEYEQFEAPCFGGLHNVIRRLKNNKIWSLISSLKALPSTLKQVVMEL
jgi:hypothetical protein